MVDSVVRVVARVGWVATPLLLIVGPSDTWVAAGCAAVYRFARKFLEMLECACMRECVRACMWKGAVWV